MTHYQTHIIEIAYCTEESKNSFVKKIRFKYQICLSE